VISRKANASAKHLEVPHKLNERRIRFSFTKARDLNARLGVIADKVEQIVIAAASCADVLGGRKETFVFRRRKNKTTRLETRKSLMQCLWDGREETTHHAQHLYYRAFAAQKLINLFD
jgi:hypothetical protein